jgi:hypothetical protein
MHHIGMRAYLTAIGMFVCSLLAQSTVSRNRARHKTPS